MQKSRFNLQDLFLNEVRKKGVGVEVSLLGGLQLKGLVKSFDSFTMLLEDEGHQQLIYKHAIASVIPHDSSRQIIQGPHKAQSGDEESK